MSSQKQWGTLAASVSLAVILVVTLVPVEEMRVQLPRWCLACGELGGVDLVLNVLLFVPFGMGLRWSGLPTWSGITIVAGTTLTIELLQIAAVPGRDASLGDLMANSAGGTLGIVLAKHWRAWLLPTARPARRLFLTGLVAWLAILGVTGWALQLSLPRTVYLGQHAPDLAHLEHFGGRVLSASLGGAPLPAHELPHSDKVRAQLLRGAQIEATIVPGPATPDLAPIVSVFDAQHTEILLLGQDGRDLVFRVHTRAADAKLQPPAVRLSHAIPLAAKADTMHIAGERRGGTLHVSMDSGTRRAHGEASLSPSLGWMLLVPFDYALGSEARALSALWLAALLVPLGYWGARSAVSSSAIPVRAEAARRVGISLSARMRSAALLGVTTALGLTMLPELFGFPAAHWSEWLGALMGGLAGWAIGSLGAPLIEPSRAGTFET